jgi:hypothetical protein
MLRPMREDPEFRRFLDELCQSGESGKAHYASPVALRP